MLKVNANKKLVREHFASKTGKMIILKDIHNIKTGGKKKDSDKSDMQKISDLLSSYPGVTTGYIVDEDNTLNGLYIQDIQMQQSFDRYPEVILVDLTHKTNNLRMPLFLLTAIDGNGETEIVASFIMINEEADLLRHMVQIFKAKNQHWHKTTVILTDKDMGGRSVFGGEFPNARLQICLFHVLRSFKREINPGKMGITSGEKLTVLEIIQKIAYAPSEAEYNKNYQDLRSTQLHRVIAYFETNWHPIKQQWVEGLKHQHMSLGIRTNNRLESTFQKLKSMTSSQESLLDFIEILLSFFKLHRTERDQRAALMMQKVPCGISSISSSTQQYQQLVTPYAFKYIRQQIQQAHAVQLTTTDTGTTFTSSEGTLTVTSTSCECIFRKSLGLPCRHIFALRLQNETEKYDSNLVAARWTLTYYNEGHRMLATPASPITTTGTSLTPRRSLLSANQKFRHAHHLTQKLASLASDTDLQEFNQRLQVLGDLARL